MNHPGGSQAFVRGRAFNLALLGTALAQLGEADEAAAVGATAIEVTAGLRSRRGIRYVLDLARRLAPYASAPGVREFSDRAALLPAGRAGRR